MVCGRSPAVNVNGGYRGRRYLSPQEAVADRAGLSADRHREKAEGLKLTIPVADAPGMRPLPLGCPKRFGTQVPRTMGHRHAEIPTESGLCSHHTGAGRGVTSDQAEPETRRKRGGEMRTKPYGLTSAKTFIAVGLGSLVLASFVWPYIGTPESGLFAGGRPHDEPTLSALRVGNSHGASQNADCDLPRAPSLDVSSMAA